MRPRASLSLDLDNKWSYMKTRGLPGWEALPSYLPVVVPRALEFLGERGLTISVFIVGQDAAREENRELLASIARAGHEIGNHSFHHEPWLHLYSEDRLEEELGAAHAAIERATGRAPIGFRGPGFTVSPATLRVLGRRGYLYDGSTLPTFIGPLARAYYFFTSSLSDEDRRQRKALYGSVRDALRPLAPYRLRAGDRELLEIPVTTMPLLRAPIHVSYVLYLSLFSRPLALAYFRAALRLCRLRAIQPSLLLHPLDLLGRDEAPELAFFPAMGVPAAPKLAVVSDVLRAYAEEFEVGTMEQHAREAGERVDLTVLDASVLGREPSPVRHV